MKIVEFLALYKFTISSGLVWYFTLKSLF